jgi:hypothetical protein
MQNRGNRLLNGKNVWFNRVEGIRYLFPNFFIDKPPE